MIRWVSWGILVLFMLVTSWLMWSLEADNEEVIAQTRYIPDYTLENFATVHMDVEGQVSDRLLAKKMAHYEDAQTFLTQPYMIFYEQNQPSWTIWAEQGQLSADGNQIWLLGETTFQRHHDSRPLTIISQNVLLKRDKEYAETQSPTTIRHVNGESHSVGARVFMSIQQVDLLSQARGHYVPQTTQSSNDTQ